MESPRGRSRTNRVRTHRLSIWANIFFFFLGCPDSGHGVRIFALLNGDRRSSLLSPSHGSRGWSPVTAKPVVLPPALAKRNPQKELQFAVGRRCASAPRIPPSDCEFTVMQKRRFFRPTIRHDSENVTLASASQGCHDVTPPPRHFPGEEVCSDGDDLPVTCGSYITPPPATERRGRGGGEKQCVGRRRRRCT